MFQMLGEMDLSAESERRRLLSFLRAQKRLRAIENVDDTRILDLIGGYPRVIGRWVAEDARETVRTFDGLKRLAKEANEFRYRELEKLLLGLEGDRAPWPCALSWSLWPRTPMCGGRCTRSSSPGSTSMCWTILSSPIFSKGTPRTTEVRPPKAPRQRPAFFDMDRREAVRTEANGLIFGSSSDRSPRSTQAPPLTLRPWWVATKRRREISDC